MTETLKRASAGTYRTTDGRFTVEQASGRWLLLDGEQVDDLGLPLTRGPFATLDAAREAIEEARLGPAPASKLAARAAQLKRRSPAEPVRNSRGSRPGSSAGTPGAPAARKPSARKPSKPAPPQLRTYAAGEGARLRAFWEIVDFKSLGDDDESLDRLAARNPGLMLVAEAEDRIVGTALGAWDGRRGWIYHVAVAPELRRTGLGRRLIHEVERRLRALGCPKVNVIVRDDNAEGRRFWDALGYASPPARQFGKEL
jgi:GNAT superfamily N-acetyltransferase